MKLTRWMLCLMPLVLAACSSRPEPPRPFFDKPVEVAPKPEAPRAMTKAPPKGVEAPIDQWKRSLARLLPAPWQLVTIEQQIQAPFGWSPLRGSRGLLLTFSNGTDEQQFWVMPQGFHGRVSSTTPARLRATNDTFLLYEPFKDAPGWTNTSEVSAALRMKARATRRAG